MALDRRTFIKLGAAGIAGVTFTSLLAGCEEYIVTPLGTETGAPFITPVDRFFVQNGGQGSLSGWTRPTLSIDTWRLRIEGLNDGDVATPLDISFGDIIDAAAGGAEITIMKTIQCILESPLRLTPTGFMGNAYWTGVPLDHFLQQAGLSDKVKRLLFYGADEFANNIPIERFNAGADARPILAYRMNGEPLTHEHGFPVRLILQEGYGYKNVKWLTKVQATKFDVEFGTYQDEGFVDDGVIRVNSRSTVIREGSALKTGPVEIAGYAVSGYGGIVKVEIRVDDGPYQEAELVTTEEILKSEAFPSGLVPPNDSLAHRGIWTRWRYRWDAPAGNHSIFVRATDSAGNVQLENDGDVHDGQSGVARYDVRVEG